MSKIGFHRHSLSLKLGVTIIAFVVLLFVFSVGLLYIRSRQLVKKEALERAEKALDKTVLRVSCYLSEQEAVEENLKRITDLDQLPDSLQNFTHHFLTLSKTIDEDKPYPNSYCLILEPNDTLPHPGTQRHPARHQRRTLLCVPENPETDGRAHRPHLSRA